MRYSSFSPSRRSYSHCYLHMRRALLVLSSETDFCRAARVASRHTKLTVMQRASPMTGPETPTAPG